MVEKSYFYKYKDEKNQTLVKVEGGQKDFFLIKKHSNANGLYSFYF